MRINQRISGMTCGWKWAKYAVCSLCLLTTPYLAHAAGKTMNSEVGGLFIPVSRSELVIVPSDIAEVIVADPDIADVHVIGSKRVTFIGKKIGRTNAKLFDKQNNVIRQFDIVVGYDLPAIRKALHNFLPHERIAVELVNTNIALTGDVSDAGIADKAIRIVNQFVDPTGQSLGTPQSAAAGLPSVLNLLKVISGQQVMLRVRVGEVERSAMKTLGFNVAGRKGANFGFSSNFGSVSSTTGDALGAVSGALIGGNITSGSLNLGAQLEALEQQGLFKVLAEPDLVAMSGEKAEFLAGGEFPIPVVQVAGNGVLTTIEFKQFGVAVQFIPFVLSDNRIRISVQPEVSEINQSESTTTNGVTIPGLTTRRAKTTVELAPGESFMIAGLLSDRLNSTINQIPGAAEIPILGALLRSTQYQRDETELVIAVTPYIVDPLKHSDVRLPTDDFRPASVMEQFFYGALGSMSGNAYRVSQTPSLEGPIGFMTD